MAAPTYVLWTWYCSKIFPGSSRCHKSAFNLRGTIAVVASRFVVRQNVRKRFEPLEGTPGRSVYGGGAVRFELDGEAIVVRPPFGLEHEGEYAHVHVAPLLAAVDEDRLVGVLLVRLGGYAVGVFDGERLVASKVGSRFVKSRHKKGGMSANRFRRRREEQGRALAQEAAATAAGVLRPWRARIEFVALGGDRGAVDEMLRASPELDWLADRSVARFFTVPEPRLRVLEKLPYDLYAAELSTD
jgi:hypothetical protein